MIDSYGRKINYLRLSVTDRCNLRCRYCMPAEGVPKLEHNDILSYEMLMRICRVAVSNGIEKIRLTGGEPLVRKGIVDFVSALRSLPGLKELVMTTNGMLLDRYAVDLKAAGLDRLNVSLDSLDAETFHSITRFDGLDSVLAGIRAVQEVGFPLKINMVVMRGINDHEVADFVAMSIDQNLSVRFIEYMPTAQNEDWKSLVVPGQELLDRLADRYQFEELPHDGLSGPAKNFKVSGAQGTFGLITPISSHFCASCNRIRVTSCGTVRTCLFCDHEIDLKPYLGSDVSDDEFKKVLDRIVAIKPRTPGLNFDGNDHEAFIMASIGG